MAIVASTLLSCRRFWTIRRVGVQMARTPRCNACGGALRGRRGGPGFDRRGLSREVSRQSVSRTEDRRARPIRDPWDHANQREQVMNTMQLFVYGASVLATALGGAAVAQEAGGQYVQWAEIEVDPAQLDAYRAAVQEQIEAAIQKEPGVLVLYAVSEKEEPNHEGLRNLPRQDRLRSSPRI